MKMLRHRRLTIAAALAVFGLTGGIVIAATSDSSTADSPLVCPGDDKVAGHGVPNPADPPGEATPEEAALAGLEQLAGVEGVVVEATGDSSLFVAKEADGDVVVATARVVETEHGWMLDQYEVCGYPDFTPATGPPPAQDQPDGSGRRRAGA